MICWSPDMFNHRIPREAALYHGQFKQILSCCSRVRTIVWLNDVDFNEALGEKAGWELHANAACCFEKI